MKRKILIGIVIVVVAIVFFNLGKSDGKTNQYPTYGTTGAPKNCRALIAANIEGYTFGTYSAEEALDSINRNCGRSGYIWNEK